MATICHNIAFIAIFLFFFFHLACCSVSPAAAPKINKNNGGFSARLIRKNHTHIKASKSVKGPNTPHYPLFVDTATYHHLIKLSIGTPPFDIYVAADSGSTLLWTQCPPCLSCYKTKYPMFDPKKSTSFRNISCSDQDCRLVEEQLELLDGISCKGTRAKLCIYLNGYGDNSNTSGRMVKETVTLTSTSGEVLTVKDVIMGCGSKNEGDSVTMSNSSMGLVGLGRGPLSFVSQIAPYVGGNKFSHCLVPYETDPKIESTINFGKGSEVLGEGVVSTPIVDKKGKMSVYLVTVHGFTIEDEFIPFNSTGKTLEKGNIVVDSGTPMTCFPQDLFDRITSKLNKTLDPKLKPFLYNTNGLIRLCFNATTIPDTPKFIVHFEGGGKLQLGKEQIFHHDDETRLKCSTISTDHAIMKGINNQSVYGSVFMGNFLVGYDLEKKVVSFKPTNCVSSSSTAGVTS